MAEKIVKSVFDSSSDSEGDSDCLQLHADDYSLDYEEGISDTVADHGDINDNPDIDDDPEHLQDYGSQGYDSDSGYLDTSPLVDVPATEENNSDGSDDTAAISVAGIGGIAAVSTIDHCSYEEQPLTSSGAQITNDVIIRVWPRLDIGIPPVRILR